MLGEKHSEETKRIVLGKFRNGQATEFVYVMALLIEAHHRRGTILDLMTAFKPECAADNLNGVCNWLAENYPEEFVIVEGE